MNTVKQVAEQWDAISLNEKNHVKLLSRHDTKMAFTLPALPDYLLRLRDHYRILAVDGVRGIDYSSLYFDTNDLLFFHQNHRGQANRYKLRIRQYRNSGLIFLAVKFKGNDLRTVKNRLQRAEQEKAFDEESKIFIRKFIPLVPPDRLLPQLTIDYTRYTLVHRWRKERLTLDVNLQFKNQEGTNPVTVSDQLVIAELKQEKFSAQSEFISLMRSEHILPVSFSKYCMAAVTLYPSIKHNLFREKLLTLKKLCYG